MTSGETLPSLPAGVQSTTSLQPAMLAGTASISTVLKRGAVPPGIYSPTFPMGTGFWMQRTAGVVHTSTVEGICAVWKALMLDAASAMASLTFGLTRAQASAISSRLSRSDSGARPSISSASSFRALSPPVRTRSRMLSTLARTTGLSDDGRLHSALCSAGEGLM